MRKMSELAFYKTPEALLEKGCEYIQGCIDEGTPITLTGMALALGFSSLKSLDDYRNKPFFHDTVDKLKLMVQHAYELGMHKPGVNPAPYIYMLKVLNVREPKETATEGETRSLAESIQRGRNAVVGKQNTFDVIPRLLSKE